MYENYINTYKSKNTNRLFYQITNSKQNNYLPTIPTAYITETNLADEGYLTYTSATSSGFIKSVPTDTLHLSNILGIY
jgi:hypothetical protein